MKTSIAMLCVPLIHNTPSTSKLMWPLVNASNNSYRTSQRRRAGQWSPSVRRTLVLRCSDKPFVCVTVCACHISINYRSARRRWGPRGARGAPVGVAPARDWPPHANPSHRLRGRNHCHRGPTIVSKAKTARARLSGT